MDESDEVLDVVFPSCDQSSIVLHPGKEPFDFPIAAVATQRAALLGFLLAVDSVGRDHLDAVLAHLLIQCIRVVGLVTNLSSRQLV